MIKPVKSKAQERQEIEQQTMQFLQSGGEIQEVQQGVSGHEIGHYPTPVTFSQQAQPRTLLVDEVKAIEERKHSRQKPVKPAKKPPQKILLKDDFGEPLRWTWVD